MTQEITMGSLFSGSGGFELAGSIFGIRPIWASEIEPFPILVTTKNFPEMKHLGDINKLNGADLEPVTIIAGGSPCQDMSIAGKREGLDGSRSNLFREQIRIIKEMRESDRAAGRTGTQIRPRYMVWENVPGSFSSNKGKDFQAVLQEIVSITDEESNVPLPPKGKWQTAGCIMGDHFTIAWRVLDAQYWGVPQRRKRIYLVADFGGNTAPKILFEREGLSGNFTESREAWQRTAGDIKTGIHKTGTDDVECYDISDRRRVADKSEVSPTLTTKMGTGGNNVPIVLENHPQDSRVTIAEDGNVPTLTSRMGTGGGNVPLILSQSHCRSEAWEYIIRRLTPLECCRLQGFPDNWAEELGITEPTQEDIDHWREVFRTQMEAMGESKKEKTDNQICKWLKDPESDSAKYKMWGNGIALPCAMFVMEGIAMILSEEDADEQK